MANETEASEQLTNGQGKAHVVSAIGDAVKLVGDTFRVVPLLAMKDLLSIGVCGRCLFRFFGVSDHLYSGTFGTSLSTSVLYAALAALIDVEGDVVEDHVRVTEDLNSCKHSFEEPKVGPNLCRICLGILQFAYRDNKEILVMGNSANDFALLIAQAVKQEGYQVDDFSLEVSVPSCITENEQEVWLYMKTKYGSEVWFQEKVFSDRVSAKDILKLSITKPLETYLDIISTPSSSFRIRLTYNQPEVPEKVQSCTEKECNKRRKTGHSDFTASEEYANGSSHDGLHNHDFSDCPQLQLEKVGQPCQLKIICHRTPVYVGGRYLKYSRNVSQTRWIIDDERMGEASVEEIIGSHILPICQGDNYKFHAAGREDIDVRMLGSGRPFLVEIQNARLVPSEMSIKEIEGKINSLENNLVKVKNIKLLGSQAWSLMREGEAEKQKQYAALVWISRSLEDDDLKMLSSLKDMAILQRTPIRVLHRRSPLDREKIIHWMRIEKIAGSSQYFLLHLCTQAGTYIKEFVHGDLGRTHPSIGSILQCRAEILQLDVTEIKMDFFLD